MTVKENSYYIAHNNKDVFHCGFCPENTNLDTGQPVLEQFVDLELFKQRYFELTGKEVDDSIN